MSVRLLGTTLLVLLLGACAHTPPKHPPRAGEAQRGLARYFPLAKGNAWTYRGKLVGEPVERTITIVGQDGPWWVDSEGERYQIDPQGIRGPSRYLLKVPLVEGTRWSAIVSMRGTERYRIEATGLTVDTPAGHFESCVAVHSEIQQDPRTRLVKRDVFCPDVGLVRIETWAEVAGKGRVPAADLRLLRFQPGPASK